jgi:hypothetical protein
MEDVSGVRSTLELLLNERWRRGGTEMIKRETAGFIDGDL